MEEFNKLISIVPEKKQNRIKKFVYFKDASKTLIADLFLRQLLINELKITNNELNFSYNKYGKPYLKGSNNLNFNISKSGEWIICGLNNKELGIDVEKIRSIDLGIAENFFSKKEQNDLFAQKDKIKYFFDLWTLKESYIKADGRGLSIPLDSFSISKNGDDISVTTRNRLKICFFKQYDLDKNYKLSACSQYSNFSKNIQEYKLEEVVKFFLSRLNKSC